MTGGWIPISVGLTEKAKVLRIARETGLSRFEVVGRLVHFWSWVQEQSSDGTLGGLTIADLRNVFGFDGRFWHALQTVGWLEDAGNGLVIPEAEVVDLDQSSKHCLSSASAMNQS